MKVLSSLSSIFFDENPDVKKVLLLFIDIGASFSEGSIRESLLLHE